MEKLEVDREGEGGSDRQSMNCDLLTRIQMLARVDLQSAVHTGGEKIRKFLQFNICPIVLFHSDSGTESLQCV